MQQADCKADCSGKTRACSRQPAAAQRTLTTPPQCFTGGRAQAGSHAYSARTSGSRSNAAIGGTGLTRLTQNAWPCASDAADRPSGTPGRCSASGSAVPACVWLGAAAVAVAVAVQQGQEGANGGVAMHEG